MSTSSPLGCSGVADAFEEAAFESWTPSAASGPLRPARKTNLARSPRRRRRASNSRRFKIRPSIVGFVPNLDPAFAVQRAPRSVRNAPRPRHCATAFGAMANGAGVEHEGLPREKNFLAYQSVSRSLKVAAIASIGVAGLLFAAMQHAWPIASFISFPAPRVPS